MKYKNCLKNLNLEFLKYFEIFILIDNLDFTNQFNKLIDFLKIFSNKYNLFLKYPFNKPIIYNLYNIIFNFNSNQIIECLNILYN